MAKSFIDYILKEITKDFNEVFIVANNSIQHLSSEKIKKIEDWQKKFNPLGGIYSAMIKKIIKNINGLHSFLRLSFLK